MANTSATAKSRARTGGSGFTLFRWSLGSAGGTNPNNGKATTSGKKPEALMFARSVTDQSPVPVGPGTVPIQPMDSLHPDHLITPGAIGMGTLTLEFYELIDKPVWYTLAGLENKVDLVEIFNAIGTQDLMITKHIFVPGTRKASSTDGSSAGQLAQARTVEYHGCVVSNVLDGETIDVGTMEILKQVVINYAYITRDSGAGGTPVATN